MLAQVKKFGCLAVQRSAVVDPRLASPALQAEWPNEVRLDDLGCARNTLDYDSPSAFKLATQGKSLTLTILFKLSVFFEIFRMRRFNFLLIFVTLFLVLPGCGGGDQEAKFEGAPPMSQEETQSAEDYEKQMQEDFKKNYGNN